MQEQITRKKLSVVFFFLALSQPNHDLWRERYPLSPLSLRHMLGGGGYLDSSCLHIVFSVCVSVASPGVLFIKTVVILG